MTCPQVDLTAERWQVRQDARKNLYTGKTYNSVENVAQFFKERGVNVMPLRRRRSHPRPGQRRRQRPAAQAGLAGTMPPVGRERPAAQSAAASEAAGRTGTVVEHPKYGTGTIVRREGEGDDAKIVVIFPALRDEKTGGEIRGPQKGLSD